MLITQIDLLMNEEPTNPTTAQIVENYFRYQQEHDESLFWAWEEIDCLVHDDPEEGWKLIQELLRRAPSRVAINYVACGPLEDLLKRNGSQFIERVKVQAKNDKRLLYALSGIYKNDEVRKEIQDLLKGIDFENFDPLS